MDALRERTRNVKETRPHPHAQLDEWHRAFIRASPDGFCEIEPGNRISFVNDAACKILGFHRRELLRMNPSDLGIDESVRRHARESLLNTGSLVNHPFQIRTKHGESKIVSASIRLVLGAKGKPMCYQAIFRDITQQQTLLDRLNGLSKFNSALASSLDIETVYQLVVEWTKRLVRADLCSIRLMDANRAVLAKASGIGKVVFPDQIVLDEKIFKVVKTRRAFAITDVKIDPTLPASTLRRFKSQKIRSGLFVPMTVRDSCFGVLFIGRKQPHLWLPEEIDLCQTIAHQAANSIYNAQLYRSVLAEQRKAQAVWESALAARYEIDAKGRIRLLSPEAERITGWQTREVEGKKWEKVFGSSIGIGFPEASMQPMEKTGLTNKNELRLRDGRRIPIVMIIAPFRDGKGTLAGAVGAFWDLSRERSAENEREKFLRMVTHQLRSPLTSLTSALQLLEKPELSEKRRSELWRLAREAGSDLREFANQFLEFEEKIELPKLLKSKRFSVAPIARRVVRSFRTNDKNHRYYFKPSNHTPTVNADAFRFENALCNLLDNSAKYTPGGGAITVSIRALPKQGTVRITVADQGVGIPKQVQRQLFKPFRRSTWASEKHADGYGMGLAIANDLIHEMGGNIWFASQPGNGTRFHITLRTDNRAVTE